MLYLTPVASEELDQLFIKAREDQGWAAVTELAENLDEYIYHAGQLLSKHPVTSRPALHFPVAVDRDGAQYRDIAVTPLSTFIKDNERWVTDGAVAVNLTAGYKVVIEAARLAHPDFLAGK